MSLICVSQKPDFLVKELEASGSAKADSSRRKTKALKPAAMILVREVMIDQGLKV